MKALLLGFWRDLSDAKLSEALEDRASLRRFCGFSGTEATPERTAFVRFRRELVRLRLDRALFNEVVRQLDAPGLTVRTGALVDATIIRAASQSDGQAGWKAYGEDAPIKGYKAHVATDGEARLVRKLALTLASVHDARGAAGLLDRHPGRVWADGAYDDGRLKERIRRRCGAAMIVRRIDKASRESWNAAKRAWNATIHPVRRRIEKVFGTAKRSYGLGQARQIGRRRVSLQAHLTFLAHNLCRQPHAPRLRGSRRPIPQPKRRKLPPQGDAPSGERPPSNRQTYLTGHLKAGHRNRAQASEDRARNRKGNGPENLAILRRLTLNLLRKAPPKLPVGRKRKRAGWSDAIARAAIGQMR